MGMPRRKLPRRGKAACSEGCGSQVCTNGAWAGECEASPERCNGIDDDCDDAVDEILKVSALGSVAPQTRENGCRANGINACSESGDGVVCDADYVEPMTEVCDAVDNDCDGSTDEDFPNRPAAQISQCHWTNLLRWNLRRSWWRHDRRGW